MKRLKSLVVVGLLLTGCVKADEPASRVITVNGQGSISQAPDILTFSVYVEEKGEQAGSLSDAVNLKTQQIISVLLENGLPEKDIRSMQANLYPWYERAHDVQVQKGFVFNRSVDVTLRDYARYPAILKGLLSVGATRIDGFQYTIDDQESLYLQALEQAIANATVRAKTIAKASKVNLGSVTQVSEHSSYAVQAKQRGQLFAQADSFLPGESAISANVTVSFAIE